MRRGGYFGNGVKISVGKADNLVIVRIGGRSRHRTFGAGKPGNGSWDLALSTYEEVPSELVKGAKYVHHAAGGKWSGVFDFFRAHPELIDVYEYFWIPDDDITTGNSDVARLFEQVRRHRLELAQPSLTLNCPHYHHITLNNDAFAMRRTNFVELMVPVFHRDLLKKLMPMFERNWAGLGLDMIWPNFTSDQRTAVGIVDDVVVHHHGELGSFLYGKMRRAGIVPMIEYRENAKKFNIRARVPMAHGGVLQDGAVVNGRWRMLKHDIAGRRRNRGRVKHNPVTAANIGRLLYAYFDSYRISYSVKLKAASVQLRTLV
jgi:hypothetical protein